MEHKAVILFDGVCNLCNSSVQFIIQRDDKKHFSFASLQSDFGQDLLQKHHLNQADFDSFVLYQSGKVYLKSTAALHVCKQLGFPYKLLFMTIIVPAFIRDFFYDLIAKNRYRWFGKKESCMIPSPELKDRFIA